MEKLLQIVQKLRDEVVPDTPLSKMSKSELLSFIEEANIIQRMRTFHQKAERGVRSTLTDDEDEGLIPSESTIQKWRVGKLRKLLRQFHKATQILKKYEKFSASRLRSHIKRHRYEEMLYGQDLDLPDTDEETDEKEKPKPRNGRKRKRSPRKSARSPKKKQT